MRVRWSVMLGLVSGALLVIPAGVARTTASVHNHATAAHAVRHSPVKRAHSPPGTVTRHARHGATKPHRHAVSHTPKHASQAGKPLIVIDPGHGGRDPGAIGVSGTLEKTVTLAAAVELRRSLEATGRYRVALTRTQDRTISLANRLAFARKHDADLLIAIHADASPDRKARGASVYASSGNTTTRLPADRGSSGRIAHALSGSEPQREPGSAWLQYSMIEQLDDDVRMVAAPARNAHFYVLGARTIPSVLLEMGFLSNRKDESLIKQPANRRILVQAIRDAIDDYFAAIRTAGSRT
jgi:N-acetylmuramoyl-L-alanine amidase